MNLTQLRAKLALVCGSAEIARYIVEDTLGLTTASMIMAGNAEVSRRLEADLMEVAEKVGGGMPLQYATGKAQFCGLNLTVTPDTLIPRPETAELVRLVAAEEGALGCGRAPRVLDVCTGSGCIALALKKLIPRARVTGIDVSEKALAVARQNAADLRLDVSFCFCDVLGESGGGPCVPGNSPADTIVCNPPYITEEDKSEMSSVVLDYEPGLALFVPDGHPLLFYERIVRLAGGGGWLRAGGRLCFEVNSRFADEVAGLMAEAGFADAEVRRDAYGMPRFVRGKLGGKRLN